MGKKRFYEVGIGEYFKYYNRLYRKHNYHDAVLLAKNACYSRFFCGDDNVIPVTVTIKVKEIR